MAISIDAVVGQRAIDAARARGEVDIPGVTSLEGTPVDPLGHLQDATILGLNMPYSESILAQLAKHSPEVVRDLMRGRTYMAGEGLLGQATGDPFLQTISMQTDESGTLNLGQRMGETYDEFLDRTSGETTTKETTTNVAQTLKDLEKFLSKEDEEGNVEKALVNASKLTSAVNEKIYNKILPETPPGTTDIFNAETGMWEAVFDRPSETSFVDTQVTDVGDDILSGTQSFEVETPSGTTDIFDTETGEWTALTKTKEEKTEEEKINSLINQLSRPKVKEGQAWRTSAEDELQKAIALEEETTVLAEEEDESIFQKVIAETLGLPVDTVNAVISSILRAAGAPDMVIANPVGGRAWLMANKGMTIDDLVAQIAEMLSPTTAVQSAVSQFTPGISLTDSWPTIPTVMLSPTTAVQSAVSQFTPGISLTDSWPTIPTVQDTQADVMDEGYLAGLNMTAEESHAITRALNLANAKKVAAEYEAWKQGGLPLEQEKESSNLIDQIYEQESYTDHLGFLEGLSQEMKYVLNNDDELMAQYLAARSSIIEQLDKDKFEHEDWYPGSQAAATAAGYWGPLALGWNASYNDYKDAQRALMGLEAGQRFDSGDWINNLGWMTPAQINRLAGYGNE